MDVTDCLLLVGRNMAETQTVPWTRVLDRLAGPKPPRLVVIDLRRTLTAAKADVHLRPRLGTNVALLNGLLRLLIENGYADRAFVAKHTVGFDRLADTVRGYPPERVETITGVPAGELAHVAGLIGSARGLVSCVLQGDVPVAPGNGGGGPGEQRQPPARAHRPGCGVMQMNGQPMVQNTRETGGDGEFPFFLNWQNPAHVGRWAKLWNVA